ncbi:hypothetical protein BC829DRAFT_408736 [Chytridium lagenaria]|nr:hypothetical protein BC829DRAFT_408736 [Chytridium lagenaria]
MSAISWTLVEHTLATEKPLLELVRSLAPDVVEPFPRPSITPTSVMVSVSETKTEISNDITTTSAISATKSTAPSSSTIIGTPFSPPLAMKSGLLSLPTPILAGIFAAITVFFLFIVLLIICIIRRNRQSLPFTKPIKSDSQLQPRDASGITLTTQSMTGAVLVNKTDVPIPFPHSHSLSNATITLPRSVKSLGRAMSSKSTRTIRSAALRDDPELGVSLVPSLDLSSLPRSISTIDNGILTGTSPSRSEAPKSLGRSLASFVRDDARPTESLGVMPHEYNANAVVVEVKDEEAA